MNAFRKIDMQEATRLTREGRLQEALSLLQGGSSPATEPATNEDERTRPLVDVLGRIPNVRGGDTMAKWKDKLRTLKPGTAQPVAPVPKGARFEEKTHANSAGVRPYKVYAPSGYKGQSLPLVVMLHGCTQSPDDFAIGTRMNTLAEEQTFIVAYPAQTQGANVSKCWNWFSARDQQREGGEPSIIAGITREVMREFNVDPSQVYVAGLSAGGAAAAVMGATYPDLYTAIGVHSGLACGAATDLPSALAAMRNGAPATRGGGSSMPPVIVFHGDRDGTVHPVNGEQVIASARAGDARAAKVIHGEAGGVSYTQTIETDAAGRNVSEHWRLRGAGHAWSGGDSLGSYADASGPDASREMIRFFLQHRRT